MGYSWLNIRIAMHVVPVVIPSGRKNEFTAPVEGLGD
jgi:hypothetical protein